MTLRRNDESVYCSFTEGLEGVLVILMIEDNDGRRFFYTTNPTESFFSTIGLKAEGVGVGEIQTP